MAGKSEGGISTVLPDNPFARHSFFCEGGTRSNYPTVPHPPSLLPAIALATAGRLRRVNSTRFDTRFFLIIPHRSDTYPPSLLPAIALATAGRLRRVNLTTLPLVRKRFQCLEYARHAIFYLFPSCVYASRQWARGRPLGF